jgi:endonuclease/exonuclease/phosphatase family metal-dependent hydrolase
VSPQEIIWDRPLLKAAIRLPSGRGIHVVNLHLRASLAAQIAGQKENAFTWRSVGGWAEGFFITSVKRSGQALEARLLVERIFDLEPEALIAVCGDFNAVQEEMPLRTIMGDVEDTGNGHLAGRSLVPLERALPSTQRYSVLHHGRKVMLDHILISRALLAHFRHMEVHNEALGDELVAYATVSHSPESYHAPVVAAFEL